MIKEEPEESLRWGVMISTVDTKYSDQSND